MGNGALFCELRYCPGQTSFRQHSTVCGGAARGECSYQDGQLGNFTGGPYDGTPLPGGTCKCKEPYTGLACQYMKCPGEAAGWDPTADGQRHRRNGVCSGQGFCNPQTGSCECDAGWSPISVCDHPTGCDRHPNCGHGSSCVADGGDYSCRCDVMVRWNWTSAVERPDPTQPCLQVSPTNFTYPRTNYAVPPMRPNRTFEAAADRWTAGKDDLPAAGGGNKYEGGVLLPDGRVLLVPYYANHVGLYDAGGTRNGAAYTVATLARARNVLLLPYYNKF